jgi:hypothetical protein
VAILGCSSQSNQDNARTQDKAQKDGDQASTIQENAQKTSAKAIIAKVEQALEAYKVAHGEYPATLEALTQPQDGSPAHLEAKSLIDPWGRAVVYDLGTRHPQSGRPLVYSRGARPDEPASQIKGW